MGVKQGRMRRCDGGGGRFALALGLSASLMSGGMVAADPVPYTSLQPAEAQPAQDPATLPPAPSADSTAEAPPPAPATPAKALFRESLRAAKQGDAVQTHALLGRLTDPTARKVVLWALMDNAANRASFDELDEALRDIPAWPRAYRRTAGAERLIESSGRPPQKIIAWFAHRDPDTPEGAMALAGAFQALGQIDDAQALIRHYWREHLFELDLQNRMLARFGALLSPEDHAARLSTLLYGLQGPAAKAMVELVNADQKALAEARIALRNERADAPDLVAVVPHDLQDDPGLAFDRSRYYRRKNLEVVSASLVRNFPANVPDKSDVAGFIWAERRALTIALIRSGDFESAYAAAADTGLKPGPDLAEAEFYAGWIALQRLHNPKLADRHFARVQEVAQSSITVSRALYWRGRTAQASGNDPLARDFFKKGGAYYTTFYGLLSAEAAGQTTLVVGVDPVPSAKDRAAFEGRDIIAAAHLLAEAGDREDFRAFVLAAADASRKTEDFALLVDLARSANDQDLALRVARIGNYRGFYLPERGYPLRNTPQPPGAAEPAFMLAITRQESSFDPHARSGPGARGMMQLMPTTASGMAKRLGLRYSAAKLDDPEFNMHLGGVFLGHLTAQFGGSYVLAAAAYNAGPGRPSEWVNTCGDPRKGGVDPTDFIECIPFTETRNYVMRVMENTAIYRARLNGGSAPLTITADLKRGAWAPPPTIDSILESLTGQ